ncbi:hypothetical protein ACWDZ8_17785, partial [Streptomyces sp. NPDC003233]
MAPSPVLHASATNNTRKNTASVRRARLRLRLLLPPLVLLAMMAMLMLRGYVHSEILADYR